jgi:peptidoglycan/xylan/chitin deacetylase (PgdA/CDA1 family)
MAICFMDKLKFLIINFLSFILPFGILKFGLPGRFIIYAHLVSDNRHSVSDYYRFPSIAEFDRFIRSFRKIGYDFVSLQDYLLDDDRKKILLSFDDGFRVLYDELHPYMKSNGLPYMIFILTAPLQDPAFQIGSVQSKHKKSSKRLFLSEQEIIELKKENVHIGFHTRTHYKIKESDTPDDATVQAELTIQTEYRHLLSEPLCFAYPYLAPANYSVFNEFMQRNLSYRFFFDTKGFKPPCTNHFFRVTIDAEKQLHQNDWINFIIKRQLLLFLIHRIF